MNNCDLKTIDLVHTAIVKNVQERQQLEEKNSAVDYQIDAIEDEIEFLYEIQNDYLDNLILKGPFPLQEKNTNVVFISGNNYYQLAFQIERSMIDGPKIHVHIFRKLPSVIHL